MKRPRNRSLSIAAGLAAAAALGGASIPGCLDTERLPNAANFAAWVRLKGFSTWMFPFAVLPFLAPSRK